MTAWIAASLCVLAAFLAGILLGRRASRAHAAATLPEPRAETTGNGADLSRTALRLAERMAPAALVVDSSDRLVLANRTARDLGLVHGDRVVIRRLLALTREVLVDDDEAWCDLTLPRSAVGGEGVTVRAHGFALGDGLAGVILIDISESHRVEAVRRDFVANVSHELKTPVGAIRLLAEAVDDASDDPEAVQRFASRMLTESDRLTHLVQQIIELSRLQAHDPLETPVMVELDAVVATAVDTSAMEAAAKSIEVVTNGEAGLQVFGSSEQIGAAVSNLVANAVAYSSEGSRVVVTTKAVGEQVQVSVLDQGIGIPAVEIDRIFERFDRVDPARHRSTGGTGLGLSIVKHVAATHGGDVSVWSVEGQGSTFTLTLPRGGHASSRIAGPQPTHKQEVDK